MNHVINLANLSSMLAPYVQLLHICSFHLLEVNVTIMCVVHICTNHKPCHIHQYFGRKKTNRIIHVSTQLSW